MIEAAVWTGGVLMLAYPLAALHWYGYRSWKKTTATIVRYQDDPTPSADQGTLQAAVLSFETADGQRIEVTDAVFTKPKHRIGSKVSIVYPPASPDQARLAGNLYTMQLVAGTSGLLILVVGIIAGN
jgi:Protein of unknown function (DUF3592)